ncbi:hypothetical protein SAMN06295974_3276 [Plantibacter flavus]|uniref:Uncharacterized protein n=1 Tax=Plantibacter flavus TaxID=150123 RepID=A0A3N2C4D1_9MICO|nr:hypothetical protein [Plantibacter flavus]ROR82381.1 hypothetical protein EDD42_2471 [Plantibacter flavus]SMG43601.1 hypothetical protein SAMN06295974_3276 [Plantibacter flavus]
MSTDRNAASAPNPQGHRQPAVLAFIVLLVAEALLMIGLSAWFLFELVAATPASFTSALAIFVILLIATAFVTALALGAIRGRSWIRGGAVTWQLVQIAVAVGAFQGVFAQPVIGWFLLLPSLAVLGLLFTPAVAAVTRRDI